jgi:S-DNA-T family DNA segregation ATPase FtsK/SpoIIIE
MGEINTGPTVTQYTFKPAEGIKLSKITTLSNDLSLALASHPIRIEAPIPGRSLVGIEVPNKVRARIGLRSLLESPNFQKSPASLLIALGKDVGGTPFYADLARMPHLLVAGSTGTGKTIFLNSLILSLLYQPSTSTKSAGPEILRFILVDPKRVEFPVYHNLPHLLCPVIYNATQTYNALRWLTGEMERRFDVLAAAKARDIGRYNEHALKEGIEPLPFIVVIIDELADLMATKGREIEAGIVRLAQMARAVGIHLVVATQRPSVEVITGLIKANITSRITFQLASQVDSRTVLDTAGAEKLLGAGDMLFTSAEIIKPKRIQAAYVSDKETRKIVGFINAKNGEFEPKTDTEVELMQELEKTSSEEAAAANSGNFSGEEDSLYGEAKKLVLETKKASASFLQRRLRLGYARAARLLDMLEDRGIVGPADGAKPREVYGEPTGTEITGVEPGKKTEEETEDTEDANDSEEAEEEETEEKEEWEKV